MAGTVTYLTELAVGIVCLVGGTVTLRRGPVVAGAFLAVAGVAAIAHAAVRLVF